MRNFAIDSIYFMISSKSCVDFLFFLLYAMLKKQPTNIGLTTKS